MNNRNEKETKMDLHSFMDEGLEEKKKDPTVFFLSQLSTPQKSKKKGSFPQHGERMKNIEERKKKRDPQKSSKKNYF